MLNDILENNTFWLDLESDAKDLYLKCTIDEIEIKIKKTDIEKAEKKYNITITQLIGG